MLWTKFVSVLAFSMVWGVGVCLLFSQELEHPWELSADQLKPQVWKSQATELNRPVAVGTYYEAVVPDTLDLAERAKYGVNHFTMSISEQHDYEMYWGVQPIGYSPDMMEWFGLAGVEKMGCSFGEYNRPFMMMHNSELQACQLKAVEAIPMLRLMSGSTQLLHREAKMLAEMIGYIGEDGVFWVPPNEDKTWYGPAELRPYAHMAGPPGMLFAAAAFYQYTGNPVWKEVGDQLVEGIAKMAVYKDDYAYIPATGWIDEEYFQSCYTKRGWKTTTEPVDEKYGGDESSLFCSQGFIPAALSEWYRLTGNEHALELAGQLIRFYTQSKFWADWHGGDYPGVEGAEHAHFYGHFHGYMNVLRGILAYAVVTNDTRLKNFVREGYEWSRRAGLARIGLVGDGQGCGCGRLMLLAVKLSEEGIGDYWDDVDLYIRNHGTELQFTPKDIPHLQKLSDGKPDPPLIPHGMTSEKVLETTVGAFSNHMYPYKRSTSLCCSTRGEMGLFYVWDGMLRHSDGVVRVNLLLNRASPWMDVDSYLPYEGKVVLKNKQATTAFVRIPLWVDRNKVRVRLATKSLPSSWFGNYLYVNNLAPQDVVHIEFPMAERIERWQMADPYTSTVENPGSHVLSLGAGERFTCRFKGHTVIEITPPLSPGSWIYMDRPEKYRASKAPTRKVVRYVSPTVLKW